MRGNRHRQRAAEPPPAATARREEFRRHKEADEKFLPAFFREWESYVEQLEAQAISFDGAEAFGAHLDPGTVEAMTPEQKEQLVKLKEASEEAQKG